MRTSQYLKRLETTTRTVVVRDRASFFLLVLSLAFIMPALIPLVGIDYVYSFIMILVLFAWFIIKWNAVKTITSKGTSLEIILGSALVLADYTLNFINHSRVGILDMTAILVGVVISFFGIRAFKLFWVPVVYSLVLLAGYQIEGIVPNYVALQNWMAGVMASSMRLLGITANVMGHIVYLKSGSQVLALNIEGECTGLQGILAFGMLSTMTLLDVKISWKRIVPIFVIGFLGAFLINMLRLIMVFVTFEYLGIAAGTEVHVYAGYLLFIVWVLAFWSIAFKYMIPKPSFA
jgi:exosortase/archaeosortase family protein